MKPTFFLLKEKYISNISRIIISSPIADSKQIHQVGNHNKPCEINRETPGMSPFETHKSLRMSPVILRNMAGVFGTLPLHIGTEQYYLS
jgi:hypothetical protein